MTWCVWIQRSGANYDRVKSAGAQLVPHPIIFDSIAKQPVEDKPSTSDLIVVNVKGIN